MFDSLIHFFRGAFAWLGREFLRFVQQQYNTILFIVAVLAVVFEASYVALSFILDVLFQLAEAINLVTNEGRPWEQAVAVDWGPLALANSIIPITEALAFTFVYLGICGACALVRVLKCWVPSFS